MKCCRDEHSDVHDRETVQNEHKTLDLKNGSHSRYSSQLLKAEVQ